MGYNFFHFFSAMIVFRRQNQRQILTSKDVPPSVNSPHRLAVTFVGESTSHDDVQGEHTHAVKSLERLALLSMLIHFSLEESILMNYDDKLMTKSYNTLISVYFIISRSI